MVKNKVFGIVGWQNSGKTTLVEALVEYLTARAYMVSTVKHTHHDIEIDTPGKDSYRHRKSGAQEAVLISNKRWAIMHETTADNEEVQLSDVLDKLSPVDLVLIEGVKEGACPKISVHRKDNGKDPLVKEAENIVAFAADEDISVDCPVLDLNNIDAIGGFIIQHCKL